MSRVPGWRDEQSVGANYPAAEVAPAVGGRLHLAAGTGQAGITPAMIDEAVELATKRQRLRPEEADAFAGLAARDTASGLLTSYYASRAAVAGAGRAGVARPEVKIRVALTDDQVSALTAYAPEYRLVFVAAESHDHAMASVCRKLDHKIMWGRLPQGVACTDVGGNPLHYIREGMSNVHVCGPIADVKDPSRHILRRMATRKMLSTAEKQPGSHGMAQAYLASDPAFVCGGRAQDCEREAKCLLSVHVYDIPLDDWPAIMEAKGASCVEGCVLFSEKIYEDTRGELGMAGARFEVCPDIDKFRMGFIDSPAWWYEHSWTQYLRYGSDQTFQAKGFFFTYKVVERRGDTLFFRILRGKGEAPRRELQVRTSPMVDLVKVNGFELSSGSSGLSPLRRKLWYFPRKLWYEMVGQASEDYERGTMDFQKMYKYYRTVSVRQTINAVLVIGGDPVSAEELVPLVVHACLVAAAQSVLGQRTTRVLTAAAVAQRDREAELTLSKLGKFVGSVAAVPLKVLASPFAALGKLLKSLHAASVEDYVASWEPVAEVVRVEMHRMKALRVVMSDHEPAEKAFLESAADGAMFDHVSALARNPGLAARLAGLFQGEGAKPIAPSYHTEDPAGCERPGERAGKAAPELRASDAVSNMRKAAISEHIVEVKADAAKAEAACAKAYRFLFSSGVPKRRSLVMCDDELGHPDVWKVVEGVLVSSAKGLGREDFSHSAVYSPTLGLSGDTIRAVKREKWVPPPGEEARAPSVDYVIPGSRFNGYVLVTDALAVFNGRGMIAALEEALRLSHDYCVRVTQAPPGCGKTHTMKRLMRTDGCDVYACPVRESADSTRKEFLKEHPDFGEGKLRMRTVDSYLANYTTHKATAEMTAERLLADEVFMAHAGKWYAMAALLGVVEVDAYGDQKQIPHIPRVDVPALHVRVVADDEAAMWLNYRNPAPAVAAWGHVYGGRLRAVSQESGYFEEARDSVGRDVIPGTVMMCMYQAGKVDLRRKYAAVIDRVKIMTAHESEGKTFDHVWLHKFDTRVRSDKSSLYDSEAHCLVAASRHRKGFLYVNPGAHDLVSDWVANSRSAAKLQVARHTASAGAPGPDSR